MKFFKNIIPFFVLIILSIFPCKIFAQYEEEEVPAMLSTELSKDVAVNYEYYNSGYKGFVDAGYTFGVTKYHASMLSFATSQGYQFNEWFYLGPGLGLDFLFSRKSKTWGQGWDDAPGFNVNHPSSKSVVMLPVFADFRFLIANGSNNCSFFLDMRVGASFLLSDKYIAIKDGFITDKTFFYLNPAIGISIPVSSEYTKRAIDISLTKKLLTSSYWYRQNNNITLQLLGLNVAYEW